MSVATSWANKMQLAKCDIMVGFPISSHIYVVMSIEGYNKVDNNLTFEEKLNSLSDDCYIGWQDR